MKGLRWYCYRKDEDGQPIEVQTGPLVKLMQRPNAQQSWSQLIEGLTIYFLCAGNAYLERAIGTSPSKDPVELYLQRPYRIQIEKGDQKESS